MTKEDLQRTLAVESCLIRKGVRNAAYIFNMTESNFKHIERFCEENQDIKFICDPIDGCKVWLFKHKYIPVIVQSMYRMNYDAAQVMMGLLLGYSPSEEDKWLKYVREHREDYDYRLWEDLG